MNKFLLVTTCMNSALRDSPHTGQTSLRVSRAALSPAPAELPQGTQVGQQK